MEHIIVYEDSNCLEIGTLDIEYNVKNQINLKLFVK